MRTCGFRTVRWLVCSINSNNNNSNLSSLLTARRRFVSPVAFVVTVAILMLWTVLFCIVGFVWSRIPAFGPDQTQVLGNMIFNYAFVTTVPSWVNEKKERVSINKSLWISVSLTTLLYILVGITGGCVALSPTSERECASVPRVELTHSFTYHHHHHHHHHTTVCQCVRVLGPQIGAGDHG